MKIFGKLLQIIAGAALACFLLCWAPVTVPAWLGREVYTVHQSENTANIPQNSIVYTKQEVCAYYGSGDVLVFAEGEDVQVGYVVQNTSPSETVYIATDVSAPAEGEAIPYSSVLGIVTSYMPYLGRVNDFLSTESGQMSVSLALSLILLMEIAGTVLVREGKKKSVC